MYPVVDPPGVIRDVGGPDPGVQLRQGRDDGDRGEVVAAEAADFTFYATFFVRADDTGAAVERVEAQVRTERDRQVGLVAAPAEQDPRDRGLQVVVATLS